MSRYSNDQEGHKQFIDDVVMTIAARVQKRRELEPDAQGLVFDMQEHVGVFGMTFGEGSQVLGEELTIAQLHPGHAPEIHLVLKMGDKSLLHLVTDNEGYATFEHVGVDGAVTKRERMGAVQMEKLMGLVEGLG